MVAATAAVAVIQAQPPEVDAVLDKAAGYVSVYTRTLVGVVAEETYRQEVHGRAGTDARGFATEGASQRRDMKSDVLLVGAPAGDRWMQFRDVFEVDGKQEERTDTLIRTAGDQAMPAHGRFTIEK